MQNLMIFNEMVAEMWLGMKRSSKMISSTNAMMNDIPPHCRNKNILLAKYVAPVNLYSVIQDKDTYDWNSYEYEEMLKLLSLPSFFCEQLLRHQWMYGVECMQYLTLSVVDNNTCLHYHTAL